MKLQRFLNENRSSDDLFKLKTFDILSLSALNLNGKNHHHQKQQYTKSMRLNNTQINKVVIVQHFFPTNIIYLYIIMK